MEPSDKQVKVVKPETVIQPQSNVKFEKFEVNGWNFFHSVQSMSSEKEMDQCADKVGTQGLPSIFFGFNHLYISNAAHNICLDFNSIDALSYSAFQKQKMFVKNPQTDEVFEKIEKLLLDNCGLHANEKELNLIDLIPKTVMVE